AADAGRAPLRLALARLLSVVAPGVGVLRIDPAALSRDPAVGRAYAADPLVHHGAVPARSIVELLAAMEALAREAPRLSRPVLALHGTADALVPLPLVEPVYARLGGADVTVRRYPGFRHELFNEPERAAVYADLEDWLARRL
ncbi:MAG: alpha/beta hydrolase, partial [Proteobacteria bacterium]|nr:alpha/beta hydrolase [Pseudomonadota bacterium]